MPPIITYLQHSVITIMHDVGAKRQSRYHDKDIFCLSIQSRSQAELGVFQRRLHTNTVGEVILCVPTLLGLLTFSVNHSTQEFTVLMWSNRCYLGCQEGGLLSAPYIIVSLTHGRGPGSHITTKKCPTPYDNGNQRVLLNVSPHKNKTHLRKRAKL